MEWDYLTSFPSLWALSGTDVVLENPLNDVLLRDNEKFYFGTDKDYYAYSNGTNLYISDSTAISSFYIQPSGQIGMYGGSNGLGNIAIKSDNTIVITEATNGSTIVVINTNGDLQVKGLTDDYLGFFDISADMLGVGKNNPTYKLDVNGEIRADTTAVSEGGIFGNAFIGNYTSADIMAIAHKDYKGSAVNYGIAIDADGNLFLNCVTGEIIAFRINNITQGFMSAAGWSFNNRIIANSDGGDSDSQVKGLTYDYLMYWNAGLDAIGVNTNIPDALFDVNGESRAETFTSDVAIGTKPLSIISTDLCDNLNADLLDGSHASEFGTSAAVALNTAHSISDGEDHSDVVTNNAKVTNATHTGEVTGSGALTIVDEAVTLAKMAHIATDSFLGRDTAATGDVEVLSVATVKTLLAYLQGDITQQINAQTGTSYTLVDADHGKLVTLDNAAAITLDVDTGLRSDFSCIIMQKGAGSVTIAGTATVENADGFDTAEKQWVFVSIIHLGSDVFVSDGRLSS